MQSLSAWTILLLSASLTSIPALNRTAHTSPPSLTQIFVTRKAFLLQQSSKQLS